MASFCFLKSPFFRCLMTRVPAGGPTDLSVRAVGQFGQVGRVGLAGLVGLIGLVGSVWGAPAMVLQSPDGQVTWSLEAGDEQRHVWTLRRGDEAMVLPSALGLVVDGVDLGFDSEAREGERFEGQADFPWHGGKDRIATAWRGLIVDFTQQGTAQRWALEVRAFNDALAMRYRLAATTGTLVQTRTVSAERTDWRLPTGATVWSQDNINNYEGVHEEHALSALPEGRKIGPPLVARTAGGAWLAITEAAQFHASGMTLRALGDGRFGAVFEDDPGGWALEAPLGEEDKGFVATPWRVVLVGADLDALVNADAVPALCPPPDPEWFPQGALTEWVRPGRALWNWWSGSTVAYSAQRWWIDQTAAMGFEHYLVDAGWENEWPADGGDQWAQLAELCAYGAGRDIGVFVWKNFRELRDAQERIAFFDAVAAAGVAGIKIDFMDSESQEITRFTTACLGEAAERRLMINFHGAVKPTGEARTFPNEVTREGVRGLEYNKWDALPPRHYATVAFTRYLAGHGDFTPGTLNPEFLKGTTLAAQLAMAVIQTSPLTHWADRPELYLKSEALDVIRAIPSTWERTVVLAGSRPEDLAAMARLRDGAWFVAVINGREAARDYTFDLTFLDQGDYHCRLVRDVPEAADALAVEESTVQRRGRMTVALSGGGGALAVFSKLRLTPHGGVIGEGEGVRIGVAHPGARVRYTLDGADPAEGGEMVEGGGIALTGPAWLRAVIVEGDGTGASVSARYHAPQ